MKIKEIPLEERPREKAIKYGIESLSNAEIIAIILKSGLKNKSVIELSYELLQQTNGINGLLNIGMYELKSIKGINNIKAIELIASIELAKRINKLTGGKLKIQTPNDVYELLGNKIKNEPNEQFMILLLDSKCLLINTVILTKGNLNMTLIHPRDIFREALKYNATRLVCVHNHPSGDPSPSQEDIETTKYIVAAAKTMGIPIVDHIILGKNCFFSFKEAQLL